MRRVSLLLALTLTLCACAKSEALTPETDQEITEKTSALNKAPRFTFDSVINPEVWKTFQSLEEMQKACQIPEEILADMTTEEIVQACMVYPLSLNYTAYNNEMDGIKAVMNGFNGFKELQERTDAADELISYYENMDVDAIAGIATLNHMKKEAGREGIKKAIDQGVSPLHVGYAELILSSELVPSLYNQENLPRLEKAISDKLEAKMRNSTIFGEDALGKSLLLGAKLKLQSDAALSTVEKQKLQDFVNAGGQGDRPQILTTLSDGNNLTYPVTVYTKCGKAVTGQRILGIQNQDEIDDRNTYYTMRYPNATFLGNSSKKYNGHSHAWNMTEGGDTCLIYSAGGNLDKYLNNDYYMPVQSLSIAKKVHYVNDDHSAVISTVPGMYESKWGNGPLMRHAPEYCPFGGSRVLYGIRNTTGVLRCSNGDDITNVGVTSTYFPKSNDPSVPYGNLVSYRWQIIDHKGEIASNSAVNVQPSGSTAAITFLKTGTYEIYCYLSVNGVLLTTLWFEAFVMP